MLAAIVKRELIDHLISLRFGLALVLTVGLMVLNALGFVGGSYEFRRDHYLEQVQAEQEIEAQQRPAGPVEADPPFRADLYIQETQPPHVLRYRCR